MNEKAEHPEVTNKYESRRPHIVRFSFALCIVLIAVSLRNICLTSMIIVFGTVGLYITMRITVLFCKAGSKVIESIDWISHIAQYGMIAFVLRVAGTMDEIAFQLVFIMPLLSVAVDPPSFACLRILVAIACMTQSFKGPETYLSILISQSPFVFDFSVCMIGFFWKKTQSTSSNRYEEGQVPRKPGKIFLTQTKPSILLENKPILDTPDPCGSLEPKENFFFTRQVGFLESGFHTLSIQKELPIKKASILSERVDAYEKDFCPKRSLHSQRSLVDQQSTVRERFKRLRRQNSVDNLKHTYSQNFVGSYR